MHLIDKRKIPDPYTFNSWHFITSWFKIRLLIVNAFKIKILNIKIKNCFKKFTANLSQKKFPENPSSCLKIESCI